MVLFLHHIVTLSECPGKVLGKGRKKVRKPKKARVQRDKSKTVFLS